MSALPPNADILARPSDVCFVPKRKWLALFDHLVGASGNPNRRFEAKRFGSFEVNGKFEFGWLLDLQVRRLGAFEDAVDIRRRLTKAGSAFDM
jgi:hypothetical protein